MRWLTGPSGPSALGRVKVLLPVDGYRRLFGNGGKNAFTADIPYRRHCGAGRDNNSQRPCGCRATHRRDADIPADATSRAQTPAQSQRGSLAIVDADRLIARYTEIHDIHLTTDDSIYHVVPDATPTGGIESDTNGDGIVDEIYWEFSDGTWERVVDYDFDADADALAIDVTADGFAEIQIWDNEDGTYSYYQDSDGDAVFETEEFFTRSELDDALPGITDFLDIDFGPTGS